MIKIIAHDTTMKIPIFNTLYYDSDNKIKSKDVDINNLNHLNFSQVDYKRYPLVNILRFLTEKNSLYETVIVSTNDTLVKLFLDKKIKFLDISKLMFKFICSKEFLKYKNISPKTVKDIVELNNYVRLNILKNVYKFTDVKKTN